MKYTGILIYLICSLSISYSQILNSISGKIKNENGEGIAHATVYLQNTTMVTETDNDGIYYFNTVGLSFTTNFKIGISVYMNGYAPFSESLYANGRGSFEEITLQKASKLYIRLIDAGDGTAISGASIICTDFIKPGEEERIGVYSIIIPNTINIDQSIGIVISDLYSYNVFSFDTLVRLRELPPVLKFTFTKANGDIKCDQLIKDFAMALQAFNKYYVSQDTVMINESWSKCLKLWNAVRIISGLSNEGEERRIDFINSYSDKVSKIHTDVIDNYEEFTYCSEVRKRIRIRQAKYDIYLDSISAADIYNKPKYYDLFFLTAVDLFFDYEHLTSYGCETTTQRSMDINSDYANVLLHQYSIITKLEAERLTESVSQLLALYNLSYSRNLALYRSLK